LIAVNKIFYKVVSVATRRLRCDGIFNNHFIAYLLPVKELRTSVSIRAYTGKIALVLFRLTVYIRLAVAVQGYNVLAMHSVSQRTYTQTERCRSFCR